MKSRSVSTLSLMALLVLLSVALIAPPAPGVQICVACGTYWIPDPTGGPSKPCENCFADIGPALGCLELFPDSDGCSSCQDLAYGDCEL
jgi:hypothetical protein